MSLTTTISKLPKKKAEHLYDKVILIGLSFYNGNNWRDLARKFSYKENGIIKRTLEHIYNNYTEAQLHALLGILISEVLTTYE